MRLSGDNKASAAARPLTCTLSQKNVHAHNDDADKLGGGVKYLIHQQISLSQRDFDNLLVVKE